MNSKIEVSDSTIPGMKEVRAEVNGEKLMAVAQMAAIQSEGPLEALTLLVGALSWFYTLTGIANYKELSESQQNEAIQEMTFAISKAASEKLSELELQHTKLASEGN